MVEITDRESLEAWLKTRPPEDAVLIAARAALRVLPGFRQALNTDVERRRAAAFLPAFRAMAIGNFACRWPQRAGQIRHAAIGAAKATDAAMEPYSGSVEYLDEYQYGSQVMNGVMVAAAYAAYSTATSETSGVDIRLGEASANAAEAAHGAAYAVRPTGPAGPPFSDRVAIIDIWRPISVDASALESGAAHAQLGSTLLWPEGTPDWAGYNWRRLKQHLLAADEGWEVWTGWYDAILEGRPLDPDLEQKKALIPDEVWSQGPAALNAAIARLIADHPPRNSLSAQIEATAEAAIWDFRLDPEAYVMRARPFERDLPETDDPYRMRDEAERLASLANSARDLYHDMRQDRPQVPPAMRRDLKRYADAASVPPERVNPRELERLTRPIFAALADEDIRAGLGNYLLTKLEGFQADHIALKAAYFSALSERLAVLAEKEPPESFDADEADASIKAATDLLTGPDWEVMPDPPAEVVDILVDATEEGLQRRHALMLKPDEAAREGRRQLYRDNLEIAASLARLLGQTVKETVDAVHAVGSHPRVQSTAAVAAVSNCALQVIGRILAAFGL